MRQTVLERRIHNLTIALGGILSGDTPDVVANRYDEGAEILAYFKNNNPNNSKKITVQPEPVAPVIEPEVKKEAAPEPEKDVEDTPVAGLTSSESIGKPTAKPAPEPDKSEQDPRAVVPGDPKNPTPDHTGERVNIRSKGKNKKEAYKSV